MKIQNNTELESFFAEKTLTAVKLAQVNDSFNVFYPNKQIAIDGGVELLIDDQPFFFGWKIQLEAIESGTYSLKESLGEIEHYILNDNDIMVASQFIGQKIISVNATWNIYEKMSDEEYPELVPVDVMEQIILEFENGKTLQIAAISYEEKDGKITDAKWDLHGEILVSANDVVPIEGANPTGRFF